MKKWIVLVAFAAALCANSLFAAETVGLRLVSAGSGPVAGGVYTSPYGLSINGNPQTTLMICDDFTTDVSIGDSWSASITTLAELLERAITDADPTTPQTPKFTTGTPTGTVTYLDVANYATAGVLASQLMSNLENSAMKTQLSFAIWGVFYPTLLTNNPASNPGHLDSTTLAQAQNYLASAHNTVTAATAGGVFGRGAIDLNQLPFGNLMIYTPTPDLTVSQEFLRVSMPEPPYPVVLAIDLCAVIGLIAFARRRCGLLN